MSRKHLSILIAGLAFLAAGHLVAGQQSTTNAKLLVDKEILNKYIVEGRDVVVNYHLINVGGSVARDVKVIDDTFPSTKFDVVNGYTSFTLPQVAPGANVTHTVILRPKSSAWGPHVFGPARVEYKLNDAGQLQLASTSELGEAYVVAGRTFDRKFSSQFMDWLIFTVLCLPVTLVPYYLWLESDTKSSGAASKLASKKST